MMFLILDRNPVKSASLVPDKLKFKQLLELAQMISTITGSVYKPVRQGKEIQEWIKKYPDYTKFYYRTLYAWCIENIKMQEKTIKDLMTIYLSLKSAKFIHYPETAIFRYNKNYKGTSWQNNSELSINTAIYEYKKYLCWKGYYDHLQSN
jgi:hypothetical protein